MIFLHPPHGYLTFKSSPTAVQLCPRPLEARHALSQKSEEDTAHPHHAEGESGCQGRGRQTFVRTAFHSWKHYPQSVPAPLGTDLTHLTSLRQDGHIQHILRVSGEFFLRKTGRVDIGGVIRGEAADYKQE
jgi:hypothetical protein